MKLRAGRKTLRVLFCFFKKRDKDKLFIINLTSFSVGYWNKYILDLKFSWIFMNFIIFEITFFYFRKINTNEANL